MENTNQTTGNKGPFHGDGWYPKMNPLQVYEKPITVDPGCRHPKNKPKKVEKGRG